VLRLQATLQALPDPAALRGQAAGRLHGEKRKLVADKKAAKAAKKASWRQVA